MNENNEDTQEYEEYSVTILHSLSMTLWRLNLVAGGYVDDMSYRLCHYWM